MLPSGEPGDVPSPSKLGTNVKFVKVGVVGITFPVAYSSSPTFKEVPGEFV